MFQIAPVLQNSRACDACKLRKKKCSISSNVQAELESCLRCTRLDMRCTFDRAPRPRGRKKRVVAISEAGETSNPDGQSHPQAHDACQSNGHLFTPVSSADTVDNASSLLYFHYADNHVHTVDLQGQPPLHDPAVSPPNDTVKPYATDDLCHRDLVLLILDDYLRIVYPLVPLVHRPSFINTVNRARDTYDNDFHSLIVALCGMIAANLPRRFRVYQRHRHRLRFQTPKEMLNYCYSTIMSNRGPEYFDNINHCKWAIAYSMRIAFYQIGEHNRSRMMDIEAMQIARLLCFHKISEHQGLNCIEKQLRKKAFWLGFYSHVHNHLQSLRSERLSYLDPDILDTIKLHDLLPLEIDDEMISEDKCSPQPASRLCITTGFIIHSRVFWAALRSTRVVQQGSGVEETCICHRLKHPEVQITHLKARLHELKYMLDCAPPPLRQWVPINPIPNPHDPPSETQVIESQFASMRTNLHSTHIWLQSILLDQLDTLLQNHDLHTSVHDPPIYDRNTIWAEREELSRQLLHVLHSVRLEDMEPNGLNLTEKIRDIAVSLMSCPYGPESERASRAAAYVRDFTEINARLELDPVHTSNTQSWIDTDRIASSSRLTGTPNTV